MNSRISDGTDIGRTIRTVEKKRRTVRTVEKKAPDDTDIGRTIRATKKSAGRYGHRPDDTDIGRTIRATKKSRRTVRTSAGRYGQQQKKRRTIRASAGRYGPEHMSSFRTRALPRMQHEKTLCKATWLEVA
jgi:hypothetical protein